MKFFIIFIFSFILSFPLIANAQSANCVCKELDGGKEYLVEVSCPDEQCKTGECASGQYRGCSVKPETSEAEQPVNNKSESSQLNVSPPDIQVDFFGLKASLKSITCVKGDYCQIDWTTKYAKALFDLGFAMAIALAVVMIMVGGLIWLMSGGRQDQIGKAKEFITGALSGLLLALLSVIILQAINPGLVNFSPLSIFMPNLLETQAKDRQQANTESEAVGGGNCPSSEDQASGFQSIATSYSRPVRNNFGSDRDFLCAVGLNCWCPNDNARDRTQPKCPGGLHPCMPFDPNTTAYCNQTASGSAPGPGQVAADRRCFPMGTKLCVNGSTYTVTDTGSAIVGTRLDIWNDNYGDAVAFGRRTVNVTVGPCP